jgi:tetratricopeptide (TPR) repeat protein
VTRIARGAVAAALAAVCSAAPVGARAEGDARTAAQASCARAEKAAEELRFADALAAYRLAVSTDPSAPCAGMANARAEDLAAHAEGDFAPLVTLERVRRDPAKSADRVAIDALASAAARFPPGRVHVEAELTIANAYQTKLGDPERAIAAYTEAVRDHAGDRLTRATALAELWTLRRERGELREALAEIEREPGLSTAVAGAVHRAIVREKIRHVSFAILGALGLALAAAVARLARRTRDVRELPGLLVRPFAVAFTLYLGGVSSLLVRIHGEGDTRPFLTLGLGVLAIGVAARAVSMSALVRSRAARGAWAFACVVGVLALAFVAIERADSSFLGELGL